MGGNVDLNRLRAQVLSNQDSGNTRPTGRSLQVIVDREGNIAQGDRPEGLSSALSIVPQETFASLAADRVTARTYMPSNTYETTTREGITGFVYMIDTELGDAFMLFVYNDGANYQVKVIEPAEIEKYWRTPHTGHLFSNGRICFGDAYGSGMPTLREAYAKSVLWANGFSIAMRTQEFPFSTNN